MSQVGETMVTMLMLASSTIIIKAIVTPMNYSKNEERKKTFVQCMI